MAHGEIPKFRSSFFFNQAQAVRGLPVRPPDSGHDGTVRSDRTHSAGGWQWVGVIALPVLVGQLLSFQLS
eukprot:767292-Hanusia_phi.AAC.1